MARRRKLWNRRHSTTNNVLSISIAFVIMVASEILLLPGRAAHWALRKIWPTAPQWSVYVIPGVVLLLLAILTVGIVSDDRLAAPPKPAKPTQEARPAKDPKPATAATPSR